MFDLKVMQDGIQGSPFGPTDPQRDYQLGILAKYQNRLKKLRESVYEYEQTFTEKKKRYKYEIRLEQEKEMLDHIQNEEDHVPGDASAFSNLAILSG